MTKLNQEQWKKEHENAIHDFTLFTGKHPEVMDLKDMNNGFIVILSMMVNKQIYLQEQIQELRIALNKKDLEDLCQE